MEYAAKQSFNENIAKTTAKPDGLTSCLQRIQGISNLLYGNTERLGAIANQIGGSVPETPEGVEKNPSPDNTLFLARQIENGLQSIVDMQRNHMTRIENAIA